MKMGAGPRWTEKEDNILKKRYSTTPTKTLAEELGRSDGALKARAQKLGISHFIHGPNVLARIINRQQLAGFL